MTAIYNMLTVPNMLYDKESLHSDAEENSVIMPVKMKFMSWTWCYIKELCPIGIWFETVLMLCVLFIHMTLLVFDKVKTL